MSSRPALSFLHQDPTSGVSGVSTGWLELHAGRWKSIGLPVHGMAESGLLGCNRSGGVGGVVCESTAAGLPMPGLGFSGWLGAAAVPPVTKKTPIHKEDVDSFKILFGLFSLRCQLRDSWAYAYP